MCGGLWCVSSWENKIKSMVASISDVFVPQHGLEQGVTAMSAGELFTGIKNESTATDEDWEGSSIG